ncbi:hypothetical protein CDO73_00190 [Saccharibacillus sp. O23]|nr:hypothetical protein CDO73_00190 [Saccharibacillus sp. O23]
MAKSAAKKLREKRIREGKTDVSALRSPFASADMRTRTTKTKQETIGRIKHKQDVYRNPDFTGGDRGSFCFSAEKDIFRKKTGRGVDEKVLA